MLQLANSLIYQLVSKVKKYLPKQHCIISLVILFNFMFLYFIDLAHLLLSSHGCSLTLAFLFTLACDLSGSLVLVAHLLQIITRSPSLLLLLVALFARLGIYSPMKLRYLFASLSYQVLIGFLPFSLSLFVIFTLFRRYPFRDS